MGQLGCGTARDERAQWNSETLGQEEAVGKTWYWDSKEVGQKDSGRAMVLRDIHAAEDRGSGDSGVTGRSYCTGVSDTVGKRISEEGGAVAECDSEAMRQSGLRGGRLLRQN